MNAISDGLLCLTPLRLFLPVAIAGCEARCRIARARYGEDYDFVKILDFGIAKAVHDTSSEARTGSIGASMFTGTPGFMAPEQALGAADVDSRADIYSMGCVGYWLLTGQLVFKAETTMGLLQA